MPRAYHETESGFLRYNHLDTESIEEYARMDSCQNDLENLFDPYIRQFTQRWNAFLEKEDKMFAEIYATSDDKMIGVVFVPVKRSQCSERMRIVNEESEGSITQRFPQVAWSERIGGQSFFDTLDTAVIVIKPNVRIHWTEEQGASDADDTIGSHIVKTMPKEWEKHLSNQ
jgi:Trp operon repressor